MVKTQPLAGIGSVGSSLMEGQKSLREKSLREYPLVKSDNPLGDVNLSIIAEARRGFDSIENEMENALFFLLVHAEAG